MRVVDAKAHHTDNQGFSLQQIEKQLAVYFIVFALGFASFLVGPMLAPGFNNAGDDPVHVSYCRDLSRSLSEGHGVFSWSDMFGLGAPRFIFRPPGFYITAVLFHKLSFGLVGIDLAEKLGYALPFLLFPLSVAFLMSSLGFRPLAVGLSALFSITPISTWGHTLDAYFYLGLAKQVIAIGIFPIALATVHLCLTKDLRYGILAVLINVYMFLNHPYMSYCLFLVLGVYTIALLLVLGPREFLRAVAILAAYSVLFALILGFYLVPFYSSPDIHKTSAFSSNWRYEFEIVCQTAYETSKAWLGGGIFDTTRHYRYGTEDWGWRDNSLYSRLPVLTWVSLLGLILCVRRPKHFPSTMLVFAFILSVMLFTGPDDFPILLMLPAQDKFQYLHAVFLLELVVICLAGLGSAVIVQWLTERLLARFSTKSSKNYATAYSLTASSLVCIIIYSPYQERYWVAQGNVDVRDLGTVYGDISNPGRPQLPKDRDFDQIVKLAREIPKDSRTYFAPIGEVDPVEIPYSTVLPAVSHTNNLVSGFFSVEVGNVNYNAMDRFRSPMRNSYPLMALFNVHYIVTHTANSAAFTGLAGKLKRIVSGNETTWVFSQLQGNHDLLLAPVRNPIPVAANWKEWEQINHAWLRIVAEDSNRPAEEVTPLIKYETDISYPIAFSEYLAMPSHATIATADKKDDPFPGVARKNLSSLDENALAQELRALVTDTISSSSEPVKRKLLSYEPNQIELQISSEQSRFMALKVAYYRSWQVFIDGKRETLYNLSPGYCGFYIPAGEHQLRLSFDGPNNKWVGRGMSMAGLFILIALGFVLWRRFPAKEVAGA